MTKNEPPISISHLRAMAKAMQESYHQDKTFLDVDTVAYFEKLIRIGFAAYPVPGYSTLDRDGLIQKMSKLKYHKECGNKYCQAYFAGIDDCIAIACVWITTQRFTEPGGWYDPS